MSPQEDQDPAPPRIDPLAGPGDRGELPDRRPHRQRRDGQRLQGRAALARQAGRHQGAAPAPHGRREAGRAVQARGEERVAAESPELDPDHRLGAGSRRDPLHRDGAAHRARSGAGDPRRFPAAAAARGADPVAGALGPRGGARAAGHPPRSQAEQHHAHPAARRERLRQGVRLRDRQGDAQRRGRSRRRC